MSCQLLYRTVARSVHLGLLIIRHGGRRFSEPCFVRDSHPSPAWDFASSHGVRCRWYSGFGVYGIGRKSIFFWSVGCQSPNVSALQKRHRRCWNLERRRSGNTRLQCKSRWRGARGTKLYSLSKFQGLRSPTVPRSSAYAVPSNQWQNQIDRRTDRI